MVRNIYFGKISKSHIYRAITVEEIFDNIGGRFTQRRDSGGNM